MTSLQKPVSRASQKRKTKSERLAELRDLLRQVDERDGYCCRACGRRLTPRGGLLDRIEHHHIVLRSAGGPDESWNLCCLCPEHHADRHAYRLMISGNADGKLTFEDAAGKVWVR